MNNSQKAKDFSLTDIHGVGEKTANSLKSFFGETDKVFELIEEEEVYSLSQAPEIDEWRANEIIKNYVLEKYGCSSILETEKAKNIYKRILNDLRANARTKYGKIKLRTFFPVNSLKRIKEKRELVKECLSLSCDKEEIDLLSEIECPKEPEVGRINDRILICSDLCVYEEAKDIFPDKIVKYIDSSKDLEKIDFEDKKVYQLDDNIGILDEVDYSPNALDELVNVYPEEVLEFFRENKDYISKSARLLKDFGKLSRKDEVIELNRYLNDIDKEKGVVDGELTRISNILKGLDEAISDAERKIDEEIEEMAKEKEIVLRGNELIGALKKGKKANKLIAEEFSTDFTKKLEKTKDSFFNKFRFNEDEKRIGKRLFREKVQYPYTVNEEAKEDLINYLRDEYRETEFETKRDLAKKLRDKREFAKEIIYSALDLDVSLAIKEYFEKNDLVFPEFIDNGFTFLKGRNLFIEDFEAIDYELKDVTLLTGVNSGGKTSTLELVTQIFILGHMGLGVPAREANICLIDDIYFQETNKGSASSGAFEATLKRLEKTLASEKKKLILIDELENITEPGASAKIIAGLLEILLKKDDLSIIVTHMAEKILEETEINVQVDGIEAKGLDSDMNLVVDRSPKKGLFASSTPELLVEKLYKEKGTRFFSLLKEKFN